MDQLHDGDSNDKYSELLRLVRVISAVIKDRRHVDVCLFLYLAAHVETRAVSGCPMLIIKRQ